MTTYNRSDRRHWRYALRRVARRVNLLLAVLALAAVVWLVQAGAVRAAPRCPGGGQADGRGRCVYVWRGATCAHVGGLVWCVTPQQVGKVQP